MHNRSKPYTCNNKLIKSRTNNQYNNSVTPNQMIIRAYMQKQSRRVIIKFTCNILSVRAALIYTYNIYNTYIHIHICVHISIHINTYTYTRMHICIHEVEKKV